MSKLALFDFDGTITINDSLIKFIRFVVGDVKYILGMIFLSPMLVIYKLKFIPNYKAKQMMISYFFKGMDEQKFKRVAKDYSLSHIDLMLRPKAMEKIIWHQERGHTVVVVSASMKCWLEPWCEKHNIDLISTELEINHNKLTGKFSTKNCYGIEKENRVKQKYNLSEYDYIYAYGDSSGDKELLALGNESSYKPFRDK